jgi:hypothetical protein
MDLKGLHSKLYLILYSSTLSIMFFYPLTSSLSNESYLLHWTKANSLELILAWMLITIILFGLFLIIRKLSIRARLTLLLTISFIPFCSMSIHVLRQLSLRSFVTGLASNFKVPIILISLILLISIVAVVAHPKTVKLRSFIYLLCLLILIILSPLNFLSLYKLGMITFTSHQNDILQNTQTSSSLNKVAENRGNIFVFLFDELSCEYLYEGNTVKHIFPNLKSFSSSAVNFHNASSPAEHTLTSIPRLLLGDNSLKVKIKGNYLYKIDDGILSQLVPSTNSLTSLARQHGYHTHLYGWYHQYNAILRNQVDYGKSYSFYNYASSNKVFSIINPIMTTFILWPKQFPFGMVKIPVSCQLHNKTTNLIFHDAFKSVKLENSFIFFHFPIPHYPFIYNVNGYDPSYKSFVATDSKYIDQIKYLDKIFGEFISILKENNKFNESIILILSDHNDRQIPKASGDPRKIPVILKKRNQMVRRDIIMDYNSIDIVTQVIKNPEMCSF